MTTKLDSNQGSVKQNSGTNIPNSQAIVNFLMEECKHGVIGVCPKCHPKTFKQIQTAHKRMRKKLDKDWNKISRVFRGNDKLV